MSAENVVADLLADELDERVQVQLRGDGLADAIDRVELGDSLAGLVDQAGVLERDAQAGGEGRQQAHVGVAEGVVTVQVLQRDAPVDLAADHQGHAQMATGGSPWMTGIACPRSSCQAGISLMTSGPRSRHELAAASMNARARPDSARRARWCRGSG